MKCNYWRLSVICLFLSLILSCSGYHLKRNNNPFEQYNIKSLSIPMFYNQSSVNNVAAPFTKSFFHLMEGFNQLAIYSGDQEKSDAYLVGIIQSPKSYQETLRGTDRLKASNYAENLTQRRENFLVPTSSILSLRIKILLIKNPTKEDLSFLSSQDFSESQIISSKVILNETFDISEKFAREIFSNEASNINSTQNQGILDKAIKSAAQRASDQFRDLILYAF